MEIRADVAWLLVGLLMMVAEVVLPGVFLFWLGLAALGTGVALLRWAPEFSGQVIIFAVLAMASIGTALWLRKPRRPADLNTQDSGLVGRTAYAVSFAGREGRVRLGDSDWQARLVVADAAVAPGAALEVVGVSGTVLLVRAST